METRNELVLLVFSRLTDQLGTNKSRPTSALASFPPTLCRIPEPILITAEDVEDGDETVESATDETSTTPDYSSYFINFDPNKCKFIFKHLHYVIISDYFNFCIYF